MVREVDMVDPERTVIVLKVCRILFKGNSELFFVAVQVKLEEISLRKSRFLSINDVRWFLSDFCDSQHSDAFGNSMCL